MTYNNNYEIIHLEMQFISVYLYHLGTCIEINARKTKQFFCVFMLLSRLVGDGGFSNQYKMTEWAENSITSRSNKTKDGVVVQPARHKLIVMIPAKTQALKSIYDPKC